MGAPGYIPGPLVIPLTFQIRLLWVLPNGRSASNVLHAIVPDGLSNSVSLANAFFASLTGNALTTAYLAHLASTVGLQGVDIRDLRAPSLALFPSSTSAAAGTGSGNPLPEEVALVGTLRSELAGRAHRGRIYLTGFDDSNLDAEGHATGALTSDADGFLGAISDAFAATSITWGIAHRGHAEYVNHKGQTVAAEAAGTDRVVDVVIRDNIFDSQRRRK